MMKPLIPTIRLPYSIKGSTNARIKKMEQFNETLFNEICANTNNQTIKVNNLKEILKKVYTKTPKIEIKPFPKDDKYLDGGSDYIYNNAGLVIGQTLEVPSKRGKITSDDFVTIMHEATHIGDTFTNPKYVTRTNKLNTKNLYNDSYNDLYDKELYVIEKFKTPVEKQQILENKKQKLRKFLNGKPTEEKIDYIMELRNNLETERNAYREQLKYANKFHAKGIKIRDTDFKNEQEKFMFDEKIDLIKQIGFDVISKARSKIHRKNNKTIQTFA